MRYGITDCPKCQRPVIVVEDEETGPWQFICAAVKADGTRCGTAFEFKRDSEADG